MSNRRTSDNTTNTPRFGGSELLQREYEFLLSRKQELRQLFWKTGSERGTRLKARTRNGRAYYSALRNDGSGFEYLGTESHPRVLLIKKHRFLERALENVEHNLNLLNRIDASYLPTDTSAILQSLPAVYRPDRRNAVSQKDVVEFKNWGPIARKQPSFMEEQKTHQAANGDLLRSKSEVLLANAFLARNIPYVYEPVCYLSGHEVRPDFLLPSPGDNSEIIWEHFGLLSDSAYFNSYCNKMRLYQSAGFVPGVNLITTFDDMSGNIDTLMIERTLDLWFAK